MDLISYPALLGLVQVLTINIVLSGDNAVVIGMVAARVAEQDRNRVILWGMAAAVILRIALAIVAVDLLNIVGLTLAGGFVLLWVAWRLYRDIRESGAEEAGVDAITHDSHHGVHTTLPSRAVPFRRAIWQVALADISMSVDNVLAVAGAANENIAILVIGLVVSIALMAVAATFIARLLQVYPAFSYVGVVLIVYVGLEMIWNGSGDLHEFLGYL